MKFTYFVILGTTKAMNWMQRWYDEGSCDVGFCHGEN